ncbi:MAG: type IV pilin-like G/H family protein [Microcoleus sp.]
MSQLIIANVAAPFVLSKTGNIFIFLSIIPVEMLVIWVCFKRSKITISFSRLFIAVLVANTATSILGIPLVFNSVSSSPIVGYAIFPTSFILSFVIESAIYGIFFTTRQIPICKTILASFLSNLASYTFFFFALTGFYYHGESPFFTPNIQAYPGLQKHVSRRYIYMQKDFYSEHNRFASNWEELNFPGQKEDYFYRFDSQGDATKASITARSKREELRSYRATIFVIKDKGKFIQGACETDKPSMIPPEMPQLVNGKFQCPSGSVDKSDEF